MCAVYHAVEVKTEGAQRGVIRVGEVVDDGVQGVTADDIIIVFYTNN